MGKRKKTKKILIDFMRDVYMLIVMNRTEKEKRHYLGAIESREEA